MEPNVDTIGAQYSATDYTPTYHRPIFVTVLRWCLHSPPAEERLLSPCWDFENEEGRPLSRNCGIGVFSWCFQVRSANGFDFNLTIGFVQADARKKDLKKICPINYFKKLNSANLFLNIVSRVSAYISFYKAIAFSFSKLKMLTVNWGPSNILKFFCSVIQDVHVYRTNDGLVNNRSFNHFSSFVEASN